MEPPSVAVDRGGVRAGSPAEAPRLNTGNEFYSVQGVEVADSNARKVAKFVEVISGAHLRRNVKNAEREVKQIEIIAGKPKQALEAGA